MIPKGHTIIGCEKLSALVSELSKTKALLALKSGNANKAKKPIEVDKMAKIKAKCL